MADHRVALPDYDEPPVIETVLGVQFGALAGWDLRHFGLLWQELKQDYPGFEVKPPIPQICESFDEGDQFAERKIQLRLSEAPSAVRCWLIHNSEDRLLQVQSDRFLHNWRKQSLESVYPRYEKIRAAFEAEWGRFLAFASGNGFPRPDVQQCEVTYINHLERGKGWERFSDLGVVTRFWRGDAKSGFLPPPEVGTVNLKYVIPGQRGRLHMSLEPALRQSDLREVFQLNLTARGKPESSETSDVMAWLDLGREWVVRGFDDFTSETMHTAWGKKER